MIALLIALQISSTHCHPDYIGGFRCSTNTPPPLVMPPRAEPVQTVDTDWSAIFEKAAKNRHKKAVGKMLAKGDCAGAEKYALERGDIDLANQVKAYCNR